MDTRLFCRRFWLLILFVGLGPMTASDVSAEEVLRLYGAVGPSPASLEPTTSAPSAVTPSARLSKAPPARSPRPRSPPERVQTKASLPRAEVPTPTIVEASAEMAVAVR